MVISLISLDLYFTFFEENSWKKNYENFVVVAL